MKNISEKHYLLPCFYASFFIGMIALEVGVILPFLMEEMSLNYSLAGGILSAFAIGNLIASLLNPILTRKLTSQFVTILFSGVLTISLLVLTMLPCYQVLYAIVLLIGVGRGTINIYVYATANKSKNGKTIYVHLLSVIFAVGALTAPLVTSLLLYFGFGWRQIVLLFGLLSIVVPVLLVIYHFQGMKYKSENEWINDDQDEIQDKSLYKSQNESKDENHNHFYKQMEFYILGGILFCYIGLENCVNGWFIQYFKDINLMPAAYANLLVSITWLLILAGRLVTTAISTRLSNRILIVINCIGTAFFFILMISIKNPISITLSIGGLGFFCAGIYPACIAGSKKIIDNSTSGMSLLLAFSSLGGIIIPQVIGVIADFMGLVSAILFLVIIMIAMVSFATINYFRTIKQY